MERKPMQASVQLGFSRGVAATCSPRWPQQRTCAACSRSCRCMCCCWRQRNVASCLSAAVQAVPDLRTLPKHMFVYVCAPAVGRSVDETLRLVKAFQVRFVHSDATGAWPGKRCAWQDTERVVEWIIATPQGVDSHRPSLSEGLISFPYGLVIFPPGVDGPFHTDPDHPSPLVSGVDTSPSPFLRFQPFPSFLRSWLSLLSLRSPLPLGLTCAWLPLLTMPAVNGAHRRAW